MTFDGELPSRTFNAEGRPSIQIGNRHLATLEDGSEEKSVIMHATVSENEKKAWVALQLEGDRSVMVTMPMSNEEVDDWRQHSDTYFGEILGDIASPRRRWISTISSLSTLSL